MKSNATREIYIGLMSGTSLDGVDALAMAWSSETDWEILGEAFVPYDEAISLKILALQHVSNDELAKVYLLANELADINAEAVKQVLAIAQLKPEDVTAIGCHGQTLRHAPEMGYTVQTCNWARLAELTQIDVVGDIRQRDVAAGGQGAPLVPAFHEGIFSSAQENRVILNIGGIANITRLQQDLPVIGFDTGPGNMLMDAWILEHQGLRFDDNGAWAKTGQVDADLFKQLYATDYFSAPIPKSTGRDLFHLPWLQSQLAIVEAAKSTPILAQDVQATLLALTVVSIVNDIKQYAPQTDAVYLCGGGAKSQHLRDELLVALHAYNPKIRMADTIALGLAEQQVEAAAFAWLAKKCVHRETANLPLVTGAKGLRVLGAIYPR
jgi:anhydro-N-acetylmuramic acid kinase